VIEILLPLLKKSSNNALKSNPNNRRLQKLISPTPGWGSQKSSTLLSACLNPSGAWAIFICEVVYCIYSSIFYPCSYVFIYSTKVFVSRHRYHSTTSNTNIFHRNARWHCNRLCRTDSPRNRWR
jgi:hypothetical protein